jgi:hypothetical protein
MAQKTWSPFLRDMRCQKLSRLLWIFCDVALLLIISLTISISLALWELQYFTLRHSPWGETSDTATVAVSTHGVPLLIWKNNHNFFHKYQNVTFCYSYGGHRGCRATSQRAFKFLVTNVRYKMTPCFFTTKRWNRFFAIYVVRLALYVCLKNICDGIGGQDESNGIPLYPLFFGWTISLICPV